MLTAVFDEWRGRTVDGMIDACRDLRFDQRLESCIIDLVIAKRRNERRVSAGKHRGAVLSDDAPPGKSVPQLYVTERSTSLLTSTVAGVCDPGPSSSGRATSREDVRASRAFAAPHRNRGCARS